MSKRPPQASQVIGTSADQAPLLRAFLLGGLVPVGIPACAEMLTRYNLVPSVNERLFVGTVLVFAIVGVVTLLGANLLSQTWAKQTCRTIAAATSIVALHVFVRTTGGSIDSPFTFSYLYIPAMVAVSFRDFSTPAVTGVFCFFSYLVNLFVPSTAGAGEWAVINQGVSYRATATAIFLVQLVAAIWVPMKQHREKRNVERPTTSVSEVIRLRSGWYLFDFSNSLLISAGSLFFAPWLMDHGVSVALLSLAVAFSSVTGLFGGPIIGRWLDKGVAAGTLMAACSFAMALGTFALHSLATSGLTGHDLDVPVTIAFILVFAAYELSLVPYNALLRGISTQLDIDQVSGVGSACGLVGMVVGAILVIPFVTGPWQFNPRIGRGQAFLPAVVFYSVSTAISFVLLGKHTYTARNGSSTASVRIADSFRLIIQTRSLWCFAAFFLLYSDASISLETNASAVMQTIGALSDATRSMLAVTTLVCAAIGSLLVALQSKRWTVNRQRNMFWGAVLAIAGPGSLSIFPTRDMLWVALPLTGLSIGIVRTTARAAYNALAPQDSLGRIVGMYSALERGGAMLGPAVWGAILLISRDSKLGYRAGLGFAAVSVLIGLIFLAKAGSTLVKEEIT